MNTVRSTMVAIRAYSHASAILFVLAGTAMLSVFPAGSAAVKV